MRPKKRNIAKLIGVIGIGLIIGSLLPYPTTAVKEKQPNTAPEVSLTNKFDTASDKAAFISSVANRIVVLTPVGNDRSGGTGFAIKAPSGETFTMTNAHVCRLGQWNSMMTAHKEDGSLEDLKILEVDSNHDLCLLTGLRETAGMPVAAKENALYAPMYVIGHPRLYPITFSEGFVQSRSNVDIPDEEIKTQEECVGDNLKWKAVPTLFGNWDMCVKTFDTMNGSAMVFPGSSGSPVFNSQGEISGVIFLGDSATNYDGYVPVEYVHKLLENR